MRESIKTAGVAAGLVAAAAVAGVSVVADGVQSDTPSYSREARESFGGWTDEDGDCQDTRDEVLIRDLDNVVMDAKGCHVVSGTLYDPYTGEIVEFRRGRTTSTKVQIDHILPVERAWAGGAYLWTEAGKSQFYNDMDNLLATKQSVNASKSNLLPNDWHVRLSNDVHCDYVNTVLDVGFVWHLELDDRFIHYAENAKVDCPTPLTEDQ